MLMRIFFRSEELAQPTLRMPGIATHPCQPLSSLGVCTRRREHMGDGAADNLFDAIQPVFRDAESGPAASASIPNEIEAPAKSSLCAKAVSNETARQSGKGDAPPMSQSNHRPAVGRFVGLPAGVAVELVERPVVSVVLPVELFRTVILLVFH